MKRNPIRNNDNITVGADLRVCPQPLRLPSIADRQKVDIKQMILTE
jgi:hypothetical protein